MKARLSCFNQVVEVFEDGKYDDDVYQGETIVECDNSVKPLMWYINGQFTNNYTLPTPPQPLTADQLFEYLNFVGVIPKETGYEPRT